jgi:hypothetical protein
MRLTFSIFEIRASRHAHRRKSLNSPRTDVAANLARRADGQAVKSPGNLAQSLKAGSGGMAAQHNAQQRFFGSSREKPANLAQT